MSEAASAAPSVPAASAAATQTQGTHATAAGKSTPQAGKVENSQADKNSPQAQASADADFEEIKIGSSSAKVPKAFAKTVKDLERGFQSKAQEAAMGRQILQLAEAAKTNPEAADLLFEKFGIDADQYSQARLAKRIQREMMSPEQRELETLKAYKQARDKEDQERKAKEETDRQTELERQEDIKLRQGLIESWKKSGLPDDPKFGAWMAATMAAADSQGLGWTWDQCADKVKSDFRAHVRNTIAQMDPEGIQDLLGEEPLNKWREHDVKRVTQGASRPGSSDSKRPGSQPASKQSRSDKPPKMLSEAEYREWFKNRSKIS